MAVMNLGRVTGLSAYEVAKKNGYSGSESEWLVTLKGDNGKSAYEIAKKNGYSGSESEWLVTLKGNNGKSAYELAKEKGYSGTEEELAQILSILQNNGDGTKYLADDGTYKTIASSGSSSSGEINISQKPNNRLSKKEDGYYADGISPDELEEFDLTKFPTIDQIEDFNENIKMKDYVKHNELDEVDFDELINRIEVLEAYMNG